MTQAFLNEPTIEAARDRYLKRWHLDSVKSAWNGRKPSQAQFSRRFYKDWERRQKFLASRGVGSTELAVQHSSEQSREVVENGMVAILERLKQNTVAVEPEPEVENLGPEADEQVSNILAILNRMGGVTKHVVESEVEAPKFVKPENFDELPRSGQVYFFLHRAVEAGQSYAIVPVKRGVAAEAISQIKDDGRQYLAVASDLVQAK